MEETTTSVSTSAITNTTETIQTSANSIPALKLICENSIKHGNIEIKEKLYLDPITNNVKLFKNDEELTAGINNVANAYIYDNEYWSYKDNEDFIHLFKDKIELTKNIKTTGVLRHPKTGQWLYADEKNRLVLLQ